MTVLINPTGERLLEMLDRLRDRPFTYPEVGATARAALPAGYHHDRVGVDLGEGEEAWVRACEALRAWRPHRGAGADVVPADAPLVAGTCVAVRVPFGLLSVVAPCRVVYGTREADRYGFAYGSLPGHPEQGEESFHVVRDGGGRVRFEVVAFSRPGALLAKLGGPLARASQERMIRRYPSAVRDYVRGPS